MPQPVRKLKHLSLDAESLLRRPGPTAMLAVVAVRWTAIERAVTELFVGMLGQDDAGALAIYGELIDQNVRKAAFNALARSRLDAQSFTSFQNLHARIQKKAKKRNALIHGVWGMSNEREDGMLLLDRTELLLSDFTLKQTELKNIQEMLDLDAKLQEQWTINKYTEDDFRAILEASDNLSGEIMYFRNQARFLPKPGGRQRYDTLGL